MKNFDENIFNSTTSVNVSQKYKLYIAPLATAHAIKTKLMPLPIKTDNRTLGAILKNTGGGLSRFR